MSVADRLPFPNLKKRLSFCKDRRPLELIPLPMHVFALASTYGIVGTLSNALSSTDPTLIVCWAGRAVTPAGVRPKSVVTTTTTTSLGVRVVGICPARFLSRGQNPTNVVARAKTVRLAATGQHRLRPLGMTPTVHPQTMTPIALLRFRMVMCSKLKAA